MVLNRTARLKDLEKNVSSIYKEKKWRQTRYFRVIKMYILVLTFNPALLNSRTHRSLNILILLQKSNKYLTNLGIEINLK
jgi:hypothetical protein